MQSAGLFKTATLDSIAMIYVNRLRVNQKWKKRQNKCDLCKEQTEHQALQGVGGYALHRAAEAVRVLYTGKSGAAFEGRRLDLRRGACYNKK